MADGKESISCLYLGRRTESYTNIQMGGGGENARHYNRHKNKDILLALSGISLEKLYKECAQSSKLNDDCKETFT